MRKKINLGQRSRMGMLLITSALLMTACYPTQHPETATAVRATTVRISEHAYYPVKITIHKGETVTWVNNDIVAHTVTGQNFHSGQLSPGQSYKYRFNHSGEYAYSCDYHPNMKGIVVVH